MWIEHAYCKQQQHFIAAECVLVAEKEIMCIYVPYTQELVNAHSRAQ